MKALAILILSVASVQCSEVELRSTASEFVLGIFEGLKDDSSNESPCINSFAILNDSYNTFIASLSLGSQLDFVLTSLKDVSEKLVDSVNTCEMRNLIDQIVFIASPDQVEFLTIRILTNITWFSSTYASFTNALSKNYWFEAGYFFGQMVSRILDYTI